MFEFVRKTEKAGLLTYRFEGGPYALAVHAEQMGTNICILYPVQLKAKGRRMLSEPDISFSSRDEGVLALPPCISFREIQGVKDALDMVPKVVEEVEKIITEIECGNFG